MAWFRGGPTVPVLRFSGPIGMAAPFRPGLSMASVAGAIERAFGMKRAPAVAVVVNSPGGSPVQSRLIFKRIRALAEETSKPVYVFCEDVAASGGYLIALSGDEIYADESSIVGSIGVVTAGFGFVELLAKLGVERRVYTAGTNKMSLDPFQPEKADDVERLKSLQREVHETFKSLVRERRGSRLAEGEDLFTGEIWSGTRAAALGLVDGVTDLRSKMRELYGEKVQLKVVSQETSWLRRRLGLGSQAAGGMASGRAAPALPQSALASLGPAGHFPPGLADDILAALEERLMWGRFGL
ncbi:MAG: S49 family peptidase [Hyphomicrobiaceae bacterium]